MSARLASSTQSVLLSIGIKGMSYPTLTLPIYIVVLLLLPFKRSFLFWVAALLQIFYKCVLPVCNSSFSYNSAFHGVQIFILLRSYQWLFWCCLEVIGGAGKMADWRRGLVVFVEDLGLIPGAHTVAHSVSQPCVALALLTGAHM